MQKWTQMWMWLGINAKSFNYAELFAAVGIFVLQPGSQNAFFLNLYSKFRRNCLLKCHELDGIACLAIIYIRLYCRSQDFQSMGIFFKTLLGIFSVDGTVNIEIICVCQVQNLYKKYTLVLYVEVSKIFIGTYMIPFRIVICQNVRRGEVHGDTKLAVALFLQIVRAQVIIL